MWGAKVGVLEIRDERWGWGGAEGTAGPRAHLFLCPPFCTPGLKNGIFKGNGYDPEAAGWEP